MTRAGILAHDAPRIGAQIGTCRADLRVTDPDGPLSSPELLLQALRREVLPVLSEVLEGPRAAGLDVFIPVIEIDLGRWPDDPVWSDLRRCLAARLSAALEGFAAPPRPVPSRPPPPHPAPHPAPPALAAMTRSPDPRIPDPRNSDRGPLNPRGTGASPALPLPASGARASAAPDRGRVLQAIRDLDLPGEALDDLPALLTRLAQDWPLAPGADPDRAALARILDQGQVSSLQRRLHRAFLAAKMAPDAAASRATRLALALLLRFEGRGFEGAPEKGQDGVQNGPDTALPGRLIPPIRAALREADLPAAHELTGAALKVFLLQIKAADPVGFRRFEGALARNGGAEAVLRWLGSAGGDPARHAPARHPVPSHPPAGDGPALGALDPKGLLAVIEGLLPARSGVLRASILRMARDLPAPEAALMAICRDLMAGRAIDLEAARNGLPDQPLQPGQSRQSGQPRQDAAIFAHPLALAEIMRSAGISQAAIADLWPAGAARGDAGGDQAGPLLPNDVAARAEAGARIEGLLDAGLDPQGLDLRDGLNLILAAWPGGIGAGNGDAAEAARRRQRAVWQALLARLTCDDTQVPGPSETLAAAFENALAVIEPDEVKRRQALRYVMARTAFEGGGEGDQQRHLRDQTRHILRRILSDDRSERAAPMVHDSADARAGDVPEDAMQVTEYAGIVLLHPFLKLLFDRLGLCDAAGAIGAAKLPAALSALHLLDGRAVAAARARGPDPLHRLLLGLQPHDPAPLPGPPDHGGKTLIEGLLRSVVAQWGRLGKTSPDGLRQTFLQRPGILHQGEAGLRLDVTPGPFDMLLDGLPWSLNVVALPWMAAPLHVRWRHHDD